MEFRLIFDLWRRRSGKLEEQDWFFTGVGYIPKFRKPSRIWTFPVVKVIGTSYSPWILVFVSSPRLNVPISPDASKTLICFSFPFTLMKIVCSHVWNTFFVGMLFNLRATFFFVFCGSFSAKLFETQWLSLQESQTIWTFSSAEFLCLLILAVSTRFIGKVSLFISSTCSVLTWLTFSTLAGWPLWGQMEGLWLELIWPPAQVWANQGVDGDKKHESKVWELLKQRWHEDNCLMRSIFFSWFSALNFGHLANDLAPVFALAGGNFFGWPPGWLHRTQRYSESSAVRRPLPDVRRCPPMSADVRRCPPFAASKFSPLFTEPLFALLSNLVDLTSAVAKIVSLFSFFGWFFSWPVIEDWRRRRCKIDSLIRRKLTSICLFLSSWNFKGSESIFSCSSIHSRSQLSILCFDNFWTINAMVEKSILSSMSAFSNLATNPNISEYAFSSCFVPTGGQLGSWTMFWRLRGRRTSWARNMPRSTDKIFSGSTSWTNRSFNSSAIPSLSFKALERLLACLKFWWNSRKAWISRPLADSVGALAELMAFDNSLCSISFNFCSSTFSFKALARCIKTTLRSSCTFLSSLFKLTPVRHKCCWSSLEMSTPLLCNWSSICCEAVLKSKVWTWSIKVSASTMICAG